MNETLTSAPPSAVSLSLAAAPAVKTLMTNAVEDPAALQTSKAVETGLNSATSFQDARWHVAVAQTALNRSMVAAIAGEQEFIANARPSVTSGDPAVTQAVTESTLDANKLLYGRRQRALDMVTSDTTGPQAAVIYDDIARMREDTQPAAIATSTRSNTEYVFSGGTTLDEFIALPQKPGPSSVTALNAELAFLTGANDVAANVTSVAYRAMPIADGVAAEIFSAIPVAQPEAKFALADARFAALPEAANTTAFAYRAISAQPEVLYDSGKYKIETPRSVGFLKALGLDRTDFLSSIQNGLADAKLIDVTDLLAANSEKQTAIRQTGSAQILGLNPPQPMLTFDPTPTADAQFAAARKTPVMQMQPRGPVSYGSR